MDRCLSVKQETKILSIYIYIYIYIYRERERERERERLYLLSNQRRNEITTERNDCYSALNVYFVKWRFSVSNLLQFHVISPVSFYKFKNLPRPRAGAASAKAHALLESPAIAVDGEQ